MGFVGNYAPRGLSPQTDGMPVIPKTRGGILFGIPPLAVSYSHSVSLTIAFCRRKSAQSSYAEAFR
mgnify:CR=1 FL=1